MDDLRIRFPEELPICAHRAEIEEAMGEPGLAAHWRTKAARLAHAIVSAFWDESRGLLADTLKKDVFSEHAQCLAILTDALPPGARTRAFKGMLEAPDLFRTTVYFMHYLFEMAAKTGLLEKYALGMLHLWDKQVKDSPKGLKEGWGLFRGDCSHAWGGTPTYQLPLRFSGFEMKKPGFREFSVDPDLYGLEWAEIGIPTPWGLLTIRADGNGVSVDAPEVFEIARGPKGKGFVIHRKAD